MKAYFGYGGVVAGSVRRQDTGTTPAGTYPILVTFGARNPGAKMKYLTVNRCSWWIENPANTDYNRWRQDCRALSKSKNEHLADYTSNQYRQAALIAYNYFNPIRYGKGSGAGIFLHFDTKPTAGCVGINSITELTNVVRWLDPAKRPQIVIRTL